MKFFIVARSSRIGFTLWLVPLLWLRELLSLLVYSFLCLLPLPPRFVNRGKKGRGLKNSNIRTFLAIVNYGYLFLSFLFCFSFFSPSINFVSIVELLKFFSSRFFCSSFFLEGEKKTSLLISFFSISTTRNFTGISSLLRDALAPRLICCLI